VTGVGSNLENYGSVLRDCAAVITTNPRVIKAYYRAGLALLALERVDEALDVCARAGEGVADDARFRTLRARAEKKREELRRKEEERRERARRVREEKRRMDAALTVRFSLNPLSMLIHLNKHSSPWGYAWWDLLRIGTQFNRHAEPPG
jgi:hypothetical protein